VGGRIWEQRGTTGGGEARGPAAGGGGCVPPRGNAAVGRARREGGRERERTAGLGLGGPTEGGGGSDLWAGIWLPQW
jgi:hypothetical protein